MKKVIIFLVSLLILISIAGCPGGYFVYPLNIDDQWVNERATLEFDLKDYTRARNIDTVTFEILDEDAPWEIVDGSLFRFEDVPWPFYYGYYVATLLLRHRLLHQPSRVL